MSGRLFLETFAERVRRAPDRTALRASGSDGTPGETSYGALAARAGALARGLRRLPELAREPEPRVALAFERGPDLAVGMLAVLEAGAAFLPLDLEMPERRLALLLEDSGAALVLTREGLRQRLPRGAWRAVTVERLERPEEGATSEGTARVSRPPRRSPDPLSLAYTIYTSGSTGAPKGVLLSHGGLANLVAAGPLGLRADDAVLQAASPSFDASVFEIFLALGVGATLDFGAAGPSPIGPDLLRRLARGQISAAVLTPSVVATLPPGASGELSALRVLMLAGEPCPARLAEAWGRGRELLNGYGPTEATVCSTVGRAVQAGETPPLGEAIAGARVEVLDGRFGRVPEDGGTGEGELWIGGAGLARGYHGRAALTAERFVPDPFSGEPGARLYASGDLVRREPVGEIRYVGRADGQVKVNGCRVELGEVEAALASLPSVAEAGVVLREGRLAAFVVARGPEPSAADLRAALADRLPAHMVPATFTSLPRLPLSASGKLDRAELARRPEGDPDRSDAAVRAPESPVERRLAEIWSEVLDRPAVGLDDDFFALGGHSLHAMQLLLRVEERLGRKVAPRLLFKHPTLAGMAQALEGRAADGAAAPEAEPEAEPDLSAGPVRLPRGAPLPLSLAQRQLWYLDQLKASAGGAESGDVSYNMLVTVRFRTAPVLPALRRALDEIVERHEVLRTRFVAIDGEPRQRIDEGVRAPFAAIDVGATDPRRFERTVHELTERLLRRPFDLARDAMLRAAAVLGRDDHRVVLTMHHIASDGWSLGVLLDELSTLYAAFRDDLLALSPLPPLALQYADVARWQDRATEGPSGERLLAYWTGRLEGAPQHVEGLADRAPAPVRGAGNPGALQEFAIPARRLAELRALGRGHGATLFMTLLAAWSALLFRRSGQSDPLHSVPFAGRLHPASERLLGFFTNMLVLRVGLRDALSEEGSARSFGALLAATRETCLDAFAHQNLPFVRLVEALRPERQSGRMPFVQIGFALQNAFRADRAFAELEIVPTAAHTGTSRFELSLSMSEEEGRLSGSFEYRTDLFDPATVARLGQGLQTLLSAVLGDLSTPLDRLPLLSTFERHQLLHELSGEDRPFDLSRALPSRVEEQIALRPEAECARFEGRSLTYGALGRAAARLARRLRVHGVGPGSTVGLLLDRSVELPVAFLATLQAGGACVPLDPDHPPDRLRFLLADTAAGVVVTQGHLVERLPPEWRGIALDVQEALVEPGEPERPERLPEPGPENLAYVVYTSGSTGNPKGVLMHHRGLANRLLWQQDAYPLAPGDRVLQNLSIGFDAAIWQIFGPLLAGATIVLPRPGGHMDTAYLARLLAEEQVTCADFVPSILAPLLDAVALVGGIPSLRQVVSGGEALDRELARRVFSALPGARLLNIYGPTETSLTISAAACDRAGEFSSPSVVPIGRPIANTRAYLLDGEGQPVPQGVAGEVFAAGAGLTFGYLNRPDLTAERFLPDPFSERPGGRLYRTGDLARRLPDGAFEFLGRADGQVKIRGVRIELGEIETRLRELPGIEDAAVLARTDVPGAAPGEKRLVAYVVAESGEAAAPPSASALRTALAEHLPPALVPGIYLFLSEMPVTMNGKIDRKRLPAPDGAAAGTVRERVAPRDRLEADLAAIWSRVLGLDEVSVADHFFDLGGHSLLAVKLMSEIRERLGFTLDLSELYAAGTVEEMAKRIRGHAREERPPGSPVPLAASGGSDGLPALFLVHAVDGAVDGYAPLARRLEGVAAVYGIEAPGLGRGSEPPVALLGDFEALAAHHAESVAAFLPRGELVLCGWSTGGLLASAMASRLEDLGRPAAGVILLDAHPTPTGEVLGEPDAEAADLEAFFAATLPAGLDEGARERRRQVFRRLVEASLGHRPRVHRTPVVLIQAEATPAPLRARQLADCRSLTLGRFEVVPVAADHFGLLRPPAVFDVAALVAWRLQCGVPTETRIEEPVAHVAV